MSKYTADDIQVLESDRERVQKNPHIYIPDKRLAGCICGLRELLDNAADEVSQAGGSITVTYDETVREFTIKDTGRGIPLEKLKDICETLNSSGKFEKGSNKAYAVAGGKYMHAHL